MKRACSADDCSHKRAKCSPVEDEQDNPFGFQRNPSYLLQATTAREGYLAGKVLITWQPVRNVSRVILEIPEGNVRSHRFQVEFAGVCSEYFHELSFKSQDVIHLALKGVIVVDLPSPAPMCTLPVKLRYADGVAVRFGRHAPENSVNTWGLGEERQVQDENDWFSTPRSTPKATDEAHASATNHLQRDVKNVPHYAPACSSRAPRASEIAQTGATAAVWEPQLVALTKPSSVPSGPTKAGLPLTKKQLKKLKKSLQAQVQAANIPETILPGVVAATHHDIASETSARANAARLIPVPAEALCLKPTLVSEGDASNGKSEQSMILPDVVAEPNDAPTLAHPPVPKLQAGLLTRRDTYSPLDRLKEGNVVNLIGIVTFVDPPALSRGGDLTCHLHIVDPSVVCADTFPQYNTFRINCFANKYPEWLPQPELSEIIILRDIRVKSYHNITNGVGYQGRWKWAIYSPLTGKLRPHELGNAPEYESGMGYQFTPFFTPGEEELRYCSMLSEWWNELQKHVEKDVVQRIGGGSSGIYPTRPFQRQHRLISETGPEVPPKGFFDCTVEIVRKASDEEPINNNKPMGLYVTDYTSLLGVNKVTASWCPKGLADFLLKIEVWDDSIDAAKTMSEGEFYLMRNVRIRVDSLGFLEGKWSEPKFRKLDELDATNDPALQALLERRKAWRDTNDRVEYFEHRLIKDAEQDKYFSCVVEAIHAVYASNGDAHLTHVYVTDYTSRAELPTLKEPWAKGLEGLVLKIKLFNGQAENAASFKTGCYYRIHNLRLKHSPMEGQFLGFLGGPDVKFQLLDTTKSDVPELDDLIQRKDTWREEASDRVEGSVCSVRDWTTIEELLASSTCPNKFRVKARIVDFHPHDLADCAIRYCAKCHADIPVTRKACVKCVDLDHEYVRYRYQLFFLLRDEQNRELQVSAHDKCSLFKGIKRADLMVDKAVCHELRDLVSRFLGNLDEVHEKKRGGLVIAPKTPTLKLIVDSWEVDGRRAYCLAERGNITIVD